MISHCDCKNEGQDKLYGIGKRVFNPCKPKELPVIWARCSVCGKEKIIIRNTSIIGNYLRRSKIDLLVI